MPWSHKCEIEFICFNAVYHYLYTVNIYPMSCLFVLIIIILGFLMHNAVRNHTVRNLRPKSLSEITIRNLRY